MADHFQTMRVRVVVLSRRDVFAVPVRVEDVFDDALFFFCDSVSQSVSQSVIC